MFKLSKLKYNKKNPRKISTDDLQRLKDKLNEFPKFLSLRPIVYDPATNEVLGGNQRLKGLRELGYKEVPDEWIKSAKDLTPEEKDAFIVIDNHSDGNWELDILRDNWDEGKLEDWGLELSSFEEVDENEVDLSQFAKSAESYLSNSIRQIVLYYNIEDHKRTLERLSVVMEDYGIEEDNSNVVIKLLEYYEDNRNSKKRN